MAASGTHHLVEAAPPGTMVPTSVMDAVIAEELTTLRRAFAEGAEYALTRAGRRDATIHRLDCPALQPHLDRRARWTQLHRDRLAADRSYRMPLPELLTRERARHASAARGCRVCWPNISGRDARPLKRLTARGLRARHAGRVLASESGESLGTILRIAVLRGTDLFGVQHDEVEVVTSGRTLRLAPTDPVHLWDLPSDAEAMERRTRLIARLGGPAPAA
ncbi:hypothetical protein [Agromyces sp. C10]|uniref:hypothetical protein n=1 Tax=Agromyces sp. C10 TaxID=2935077 RepID=UPI00200B545C|nr:hypothetical protein [Agromyces sp. C10]MCK8608896.1 hypothetical protein [Agromyces sp. C10]